MSPTVKFVMLGLVCVSGVKRREGEGALVFRLPYPLPAYSCNGVQPVPARLYML